VANPFLKISSQVVNNVTAGDQNWQIVLTSPTGDVLVFWYQSTDSYRIQVLDADGNDVSAEIATSNARPPIWLQDGSFVALDSAGADTVVNQYSRTGTLLATSPDLGFPITAVDQLVELDDGNILVTSTTITSGSTVTVTGQLLDSALQTVGSSFAIGSNNSADFYRYEALEGGGFIGFIYTPFAVNPAAQRFAADGTMLGAPIVMSGKLMTAAALPDGGFVLTVSRTVVDGSSYGIVARIFNADGTARTAEFIANTITAGEQSYSNVTVVDDDLFLITWGLDEHAQLFDMNGRKIGAEIVLEPGGGSDGWRYGTYGWSMDGHGDHGFVTASASSNDIALSYWEIDRANVLLGTSAPDSFDGGGAADRIMVGYGGDDTYRVDSAGDEVQEIAGEGNDTLLTGLSYALGAGQSIETLATLDDAGTSAINLTGNKLAQTIRGNAGANQLTGGEGGDTMIGLGGNDWYFVIDGADVVLEAVGGGTDRIFASTSYILAAGVEVEMMTTYLNVGTKAINLTGNAFTQAIYGNAGVNQLNGGGGADSLVGLDGNDSYVIVDGREVVFETAGAAGGYDRLFTAVDYRLRAGSAVEEISTDFQAGTAAIDITGNEFRQSILGNAGANILDGGGGGDHMYGFQGDDWYFVRHADDRVHEGAGGTDRVFASVSHVLSSGAEIEMLTTTNHGGTDAINLTGNGFAQAIYGNAGNNQLNSGGGADSLVGLAGNDWYYLIDGQETIFESVGGGSDRILTAADYRLRAGAEVEMITTNSNPGVAAIDLTGNEFAQAIYGNAGANILDGGAGKDVLVGNGGADIFLFSTALNTAPGTAFGALAATANVDQIHGFTFDDKIGLDAARFGLTPGALPAGAFVTGTAAADANDRIIYDPTTGALMFDADGNGAAAAQLFAYISGPFSLDSTYFAVI